jgi:hypothetical protein
MSFEINSDFLKNPKLLSKYSFSKTNRTLTVSNDDGQLILDLPFQINKVEDKFFDKEKNSTQILLFKHRYFGQQNIVKIKINDNGDTKTLGYIFSISGILDSDIFNKDKWLTISSVCGLTHLLNGFEKTPQNKVVYRTESNYVLEEFLPNDILLCSLSTDQIELSEELITSLLFNLNEVGFYLVNNENLNFNPRSHKIHEEKYFALHRQDNIFTFNFSMLDNSLKSDLYLKDYIHYQINAPIENLNMFILSYQCFEILIDIVLRKEVEIYISSDAAKELTGFKLKEKILEIEKAKKRLDIIFNTYCKDVSRTVLEILILIEEFDKLYGAKGKHEIKDFYGLRNTIFHNFKHFLQGNDEEKRDKYQRLEQLVFHTEILTIEVICQFKRSSP